VQLADADVLLLLAATVAVRLVDVLQDQAAAAKLHLRAVDRQRAVACWAACSVRAAAAAASQLAAAKLLVVAVQLVDVTAVVQLADATADVQLADAAVLLLQAAAAKLLLAVAPRRAAA
jgi:hypothetical protein